MDYVISVIVCCRWYIISGLGEKWLSFYRLKLRKLIVFIYYLLLSISKELKLIE